MPAKFDKAAHLTDSQRASIASRYKSNPSKWSVRNLAKDAGVGRGAVQEVVKNLPKQYKSDKHINEKQRKHAKFLGKKLPKHIVHAEHEGRNKEIASRPATSMEKPVARALRAMGISFKTQVDVSTLVGENNPELGIVDFYIPSKKIVINADGPRHTMPNVKARIARQDSLLSKHGYKVIHISRGDINNVREVLGSRIQKSLSGDELRKNKGKSLMETLKVKLSIS